MLEINNKTYRRWCVQPLAAACLLACAACSGDDALPTGGTDPQPDKSPIELTVGIVGESPAATTRTVVTTDKTGTPNANPAKKFSAGTSLYMVMKSEENNNEAVYTRTIGYAQEEKDANNTYVKFAPNYGRFWEDSHSRNSQLSVYAACVPGYYLAASVYGGITANGTPDSEGLAINNSSEYSNTWNASLGAATIHWPLRCANAAARAAAVKTQNVAFLSAQDLCFSNNVSNIDEDEADGVAPADHRITFDESSRKFGSGRMVFYHAMTRITFKIKKGEGFLAGDPFAFSHSNENIVLKNFYTTGTFDLAKGEFTAKSAQDIEQLAVLTPSADDVNNGVVYELSALMLPGTDLNDGSRDNIYFTIDNNLYHLKKSDLMTALSGQTTNLTHTSALDGNKMRPGVHYVFTMTVGKKKMDNLTAAVVDWETVGATANPTNARVNIVLLDKGVKQENKAGTFDFYRKAVVAGSVQDNDFEDYSDGWVTGYTTDGKATVNWNTTTNAYYTGWYWPDNKTFYHFRIVMPANHAITTTSGVDYITLTPKAYSATPADSYVDVCWGAPFKAKDDDFTTPALADKLTYDPNNRGFDGNVASSHQISKAIGATDDPIRIILFHMMSDVKIVLKTTTGDDKVTLDGSTLSFSNIASGGTVRMGDGLVTPGTIATFDGGTVASTTHDWRWGLVPQDLSNVVLTITTADHNQYKINMGSQVTSTVSNNIIANTYPSATGGYTINRWLPNYQYTYTFTLKKTGIANIVVTLADWETVTAGNDDVKIQ